MRRWPACLGPACMAPVYLAAVLALAPVAHAEISCERLEELVGFARSGFSGIVIDTPGTPRSELPTSYKLMPADTCFVSLFAEPVYLCERVVSSEAPALGDYEGLLSALRSCLPGWTGEVETGDGSGGDMIPMRTLYLAEPGPGSSLEWTLALDRHQMPGNADFHVLLGLSVR